jgi:hypothetical protein
VEWKHWWSHLKIQELLHSVNGLRKPLHLVFTQYIMYF